MEEDKTRQEETDTSQEERTKESDRERWRNVRKKETKQTIEETGKNRMNRRERAGEMDNIYTRRGQYRPKYSKNPERT